MMDGEFGRLTVTWNVKINKTFKKKKSNKNGLKEFVQFKNKYQNKNTTCFMLRVVEVSENTHVGYHANFLLEWLAIDKSFFFFYQKKNDIEEKRSCT